jgi:hypothetical protein
MICLERFWNTAYVISNQASITVIALFMNQTSKRFSIMSTAPVNYSAWVLRFWRENPLAPWRIALEEIATGERKGFPDLDALYLHLQTYFISEQPLLKDTPADDE